MEVCLRLIKFESYIDPDIMKIVSIMEHSWFYEPDLHATPYNITFIFREFQIKFRHEDG
jgi:hypothetical protein